MAGRSLMDANRRVVAVVSVLVLTAACLFAFAAGRMHLFEGGYTMTGEFADTAGLKAGDDVRVAGVKVGRVDALTPDFRRGHIVVTWTVEDGVDLGGGTRAEVAMATLLGGRYLKLSGPVSKPFAADLPEERRRVPLSRTSVPFTVTQAVEGSTKITRSLDTKAVNKLLDETAKIDLPSSQRLGKMLRDFREVSTALNDQYPEIQQLIANGKRITGTLADKDRELARIVDASRTLLATLARRRDELAATVGEGSRLVTTLSDVITKHRAELNGLLSDLHVLTTRLEPNMEVLNADFALLGPTFQGVANTKGNGPFIEGLMTGFGPIQPQGPVSTRRGGGS